MPAAMAYHGFVIAAIAFIRLDLTAKIVCYAVCNESENP